MITAAHCVEHGAVPFTINHRGNTYRVSEQRPLKCYTDKSDEGFDVQFPADIAVLVLDTAVPDAKPGEDYLELWDVAAHGDMTGKTFTLIGWGLSGPVGSSYDGSMSVLHQAENVVNEIEDNTLIYTFDRGDEGGLPKEGLGNVVTVAAQLSFEIPTLDVGTSLASNHGAWEKATVPLTDTPD